VDARNNVPGLSQAHDNLTEAVHAPTGRRKRLAPAARDPRPADDADQRPEAARMVDDIVVEFGNALYQDTIDKFVIDSVGAQS
jgi:hypothetical protein